MKRIYNQLKQAEGMSLIEVMTALVILSIVMTILCSFLFMGISLYERITAESQIRSQGDAIASQIISELKDAVYVAKGTSRNEITFVKRAIHADGSFDNELYVKNYLMRIEPIKNSTSYYGIGLYDVSDTEETLLKRYDLSAPYTLKAADPADSFSRVGFTVIHNQLVEIDLIYEKLINTPTKSALLENPGYQINTKIPLFRSE